MHKRRKLGLEGEDRAAEYLEAKGYRIVARNVRADRVEIDLVARKGSLLVFVEVKARHGTSHGLAAEAVDARKQRRLRRGAWAWLETDPEAARGTRGRRFDVVTCVRGAEGDPEPGRSVGASAGPSTSPGTLPSTFPGNLPVPQKETAVPGRVRRSIHSAHSARSKELHEAWTFEHWMAAF